MKNRPFSLLMLISLIALVIISLSHTRIVLAQTGPIKIMTKTFGNNVWTMITTGNSLCYWVYIDPDTDHDLNNIYREIPDYPTDETGNFLSISSYTGGKGTFYENYEDYRNAKGTLWITEPFPCPPNISPQGNPASIYELFILIRPTLNTTLMPALVVLVLIFILFGRSKTRHA